MITENSILQVEKDPVVDKNPGKKLSLYLWPAAIVAKHVALPLVVGVVIGSNLGLTPRHN